MFKKRILAMIMVTFMMMTCLPQLTTAAETSSALETTQAKPLQLWYDEPAADSIEGWYNQSLPIGNGYMGANIFGGVAQERVQITENSLFTGGGSYIDNRYLAGLENFSDVYLDFDHSFETASDYQRNLSLDDAIAGVNYQYDGVTYQREYFSSYPDKVLVIKLSASQAGSLSFTLRPTIPDKRDYLISEGDNSAKTGRVTAQGDTIILSGNSEYYNVDFEGQFKVMPSGGTLTAANDANNDNGTVRVENADSAVIIVAVGTNYVLDSKVFTASRTEKLAGNPHPHAKVTEYLQNAAAKGYEQLKEAHLSDYQGLFSRVKLDLDGAVPDVTTDVLIDDFKAGNKNLYLEELQYQYGRYLLISSSRKGCLPANLQGIWNAYEMAPWGSGYWYNVNVQMNYWPAFSANLAEMFEPYVDFNSVRMEQAQNIASDFVKKYSPENYQEGQGANGWIVGTGNTPYTVGNPGGNSGPGTGGFTTQAYWDYYDFTRNDSLMDDVVYPALSGMSKFYSRFVKNYNGKWLTPLSFSPEQSQNGVSYQTIGCAFDQQMIYQNNSDVLKAADILNQSGNGSIVDNGLMDTIRSQIDYYDPVQVGLSGQVKEYREENYYGEIGEYQHRHISQLVGLYPGNVINSETPAWLDAAKVTLRERGITTGTGWSKAHKLGMWARTGEGNTCHQIIEALIKSNLYDNLWNNHGGVFQIDANLGTTAGVSEMLLQSHEGYLSMLPALPDDWAAGSYSGLKARGNFDVSAEWANSQAQRFKIKSNAGVQAKVKYLNIARATVTTSEGVPVNFTAISDDLISFDTTAGVTYIISQIPAHSYATAPTGLKASKTAGQTALTWTASMPSAAFNIYRAVDSSPVYELLAQGVSDTSYTDSSGLPNQCTYKVTATEPGKEESTGITKTVAQTPNAVSHATGFYSDAATLQLSWDASVDAQKYILYQSDDTATTKVTETTDNVLVLKNPNPAAVYSIAAVFEGNESAPASVTIADGAGLAVKTALSDAIAAIRALSVRGYSPTDLATINGVLNPALSVFNNVQATQEEVDNTTAAVLAMVAEAEYMSYNVALKKPIAVDPSSTNSSYPNSAINDGNMSTRYSGGSGAYDRVDVEIDLGDIYDISKVVVSDFTDSSYPRRTDNIIIQAYSNGAWNQIVNSDTTAGTVSGSIFTNTFNLSTLTQASKIKVACLNNENNKDISLWEIEVWGAKHDNRPKITGVTINPAKPGAAAYEVDKNVDNLTKFYTDRPTYTTAHIGSGLKGGTQIRLPISDSTRSNNPDLNAFLTSNAEYFNFTANAPGTVYVLSPSDLSNKNYTAANGWTVVNSGTAPAKPDVLLNAADPNDWRYVSYNYDPSDSPYYTSKFQWSSEAVIGDQSMIRTPKVVSNPINSTTDDSVCYIDQRTYVYSKTFKKDTAVSIPVIGVSANENLFVVVKLDENSLSDNADLGALSYNGTDVVGFNPDTTEYNITLPMDTTSAKITAAAADSAATVAMNPSNGTVDVSGGSATATITVTAENGTTKIYTLHFKALILTNVARNKTMNLDVQPATSITGYAATNIVDGLLTTRYAAGSGSTAKDRVTATIDLSDTYDLYQFVFAQFYDSNNRRADTVRVEVYRDGAWSDAVTGTTGSSAVSGNVLTTTLSLPAPVRGSKMRVTAVNDQKDKDISIWEIQAMGCPAPVIVTPDAPVVIADDIANSISGLDLMTMEYAISINGGATYSAYISEAIPSLGGSKMVKVRVKSVGDTPCSADTVLTFTPNNGDVGGDGIIDITDVVMAAEIAVGNTGYTTEQAERANVDSKTDEEVNISDVIMIAERAVGETVPFPVDLP